MIPTFPARVQSDVNVTPADQNPPSASTSVPVKVKSNFLSPPRIEPVSASNATNSDLTRIKNRAVTGLIRLRGSVENLVDEESMRLRGVRHEAFGPVANISLRLEEERERLKHVNRKLSEKQDSYNRAVEEYEHSRGVLVAAQGEEKPTAPGA